MDKISAILNLQKEISAKTQAAAIFLRA